MTEKKVIETKYGWYQKNDDKVNINEIIGIVKTNEPTNSVQLKKETQLSICEKRLIKLEKENEQLKSELLDIEEDRDYYKTKASSLEEGYLQLQDREIRLIKENEQLQQELFESEEERLMIDYSDNPVRRDANIELLREYFKKRFGRDFE